MGKLFFAFVLIYCFYCCHFAEVRGDDEVEVVFIRKRSSRSSELPLEFTAFGEKYDLNLSRNKHLLAPYFQVWRHETGDSVHEALELSRPRDCHYIHQDERSTAAVSICDDGVQGLILLDNVTLEISPMEANKNRTSGIPHFVKRSRMTPVDYFLSERRFVIPTFKKRFASSSSSSELTIELAVFFDEPGYRLFAPFFKNDERQMRDMLLAYINAVQALYYHPSLGKRINIALVRLDLMKSQPSTLPHFNGQREKLLDSFCQYAADNNPKEDQHPNHWDMGLYVSALDFYADENGKRNGVTMGLATVSGVCYHQYSCVIAEFGVTNQWGKPYPSAGFTSVYIAAHEIGHNLGMHHDSTGNSCPREGYIMSPSRGTNGEVLWSTCSRDVALDLASKKPCLLDKTEVRTDKHLEHERFFTLPGREWTAKKQCELLLRDNDAQVVTLANACQSLQCSSPHRSGYYYSGPALEGTTCAAGKECRGGECVPALHFPSQKPQKPKPGGWSKWIEGKCRSGCIKKSKGAKAKQRTCRNDTENDCKGVAYGVDLCEDSKICKKRKTAEDFASEKCREFSDRLPELDSEASGLQAPHEVERPWMGCAVFCKRRDIASYYTPRIELNDLGLDPYFPDGTWCHNEGGLDYFCLQHHCLPQDFDFGRNSGRNSLGELGDFDLGLQNAKPGDDVVSEEMRKYLSLGVDGNPLSKILPDEILEHDGDGEFQDDDYLELPDDIK